jgi:hypothetical protein
LRRTNEPGASAEPVRGAFFIVLGASLLAWGGIAWLVATLVG